MNSNQDDQKDLELVTVLTTGEAAVLTVAESILQGADIPYLAKGKGIQDLFGIGQINIFSSLTGSVRLQVRSLDREAALKVLEELLANEDDYG